MDYTRVVVHGERRRANVVVPSDEPIAGVLPRLLELLEDKATGTGALALTTSLGEPLAADQSLAEQEIRDGSVLLLVRSDVAPPPPEISDLTEAVGNERERRLDLWGYGWARGASAILLAGLGALLVALLAPQYGTATAGGAIVALLVAMALCRWVRRWPAAGVAGVAIGAAAMLGAGVAARLPHAHALGILTPLLGALAFGWAAAALSVGLAGGRSDVLVGGLLGLGAAALPLALIALGLSPLRAACAAAGVLLVLLGMVPGLALGMSGLSSIEDRAVAGATVSRAEAHGGVTRAYATLLWATLALCAPLAACLVPIAASGGRFALAFAICLMIVVACRARFFPLAEQVLACALVVATGLATLLATADWPLWGRVLLVAATAAILLGVLAGRPAAHLSARIRTVVNTVELIATVALVPLLLALFGVFEDLLRVWRV